MADAEESGLSPFAVTGPLLGDSAPRMKTLSLNEAGAGQLAVEAILLAADVVQALEQEPGRVDPLRGSITRVLGRGDFHRRHGPSPPPPVPGSRDR